MLSSSGLQSRAALCFLTDDISRYACGNGFLDQFEECDPGYAFLDTDPCCARNCRLRRGAQCSFRNAPCCTKTCKIAPATQKCSPKGGLSPCYEASFCQGNHSMHCPQPLPLPNKSPCQDDGWCWFGRCISFCERTGLSNTPTRHLRPCECDSDNLAMCKQCCMDTNAPKPKCQVEGGVLKDGASCLLGICKSGVCTRKRNIAQNPNTFLPFDRNTPQNSGVTLSPSSKRSCYQAWLFMFLLIIHQV
ncbi:disintegrin and metalloproteinase domain-containing protein 17 [Plakobranchus ocellatus]|uniref:Disintegrin and metalloproteinase domain-containing protein 17 n=1 Tax=Plakobranchus ocellatus TaxID=259542 RepID=A0AAV4AWL0_9GAST|nr:disintegrin and metalloproteinase domain-containing protein 17 [Plakobranchus ocellatus]